MPKSIDRRGAVGKAPSTESEEEILPIDGRNARQSVWDGWGRWGNGRQMRWHGDTQQATKCQLWSGTELAPGAAHYARRGSKTTRAKPKTCILQRCCHNPSGHYKLHNSRERIQADILGSKNPTIIPARTNRTHQPNDPNPACGCWKGKAKNCPELLRFGALSILWAWRCWKGRHP